MPGSGRGAIAAAIADPKRPEADTKRDADRKPADMLAFAGVKPGDKVGDFIAGGGYFTRLFARAVGPKGRVYAFQPLEIGKVAPKYLTEIKAVAADYDNVTVLETSVPDLKFPEPLDVIWTSQNYHDLYVDFMGPADVPAVNRKLYESLKPGGVLIVVDHVAPSGSGTSATSSLHRIDPEAVKRAVTAAGFEFVGESKVLANPADPHDKLVFDPSIRGHTDQFAYKFRKPRR
jgi:predicted methyltransferase